MSRRKTCADVSLFSSGSLNVERTKQWQRKVCVTERGGSVQCYFAREKAETLKLFLDETEKNVLRDFLD